jgi:hypothetical protein
MENRLQVLTYLFSAQMMFFFSTHEGIVSEIDSLVPPNQQLEETKFSESNVDGFPSLHLMKLITTFSRLLLFLLYMGDCEETSFSLS